MPVWTGATRCVSCGWCTVLSLPLPSSTSPSCVCLCVCVSVCVSGCMCVCVRSLTNHLGANPEKCEPGCVVTQATRGGFFILEVSTVQPTPHITALLKMHNSVHDFTVLIPI